MDFFVKSIGGAVLSRLWSAKRNVKTTKGMLKLDPSYEPDGYYEDDKKISKIGFNNSSRQAIDKIRAIVRDPEWPNERCDSCGLVSDYLIAFAGEPDGASFYCLQCLKEAELKLKKEMDRDQQR